MEEVKENETHEWIQCTDAKRDLYTYYAIYLNYISTLVCRTTVKWHNPWNLHFQHKIPTKKIKYWPTVTCSRTTHIDKKNSPTTIAYTHTHPVSIHKAISYNVLKQKQINKMNLNRKSKIFSKDWDPWWQNIHMYNSSILWAPQCGSTHRILCTVLENRALNNPETSYSFSKAVQRFSEKVEEKNPVDKNSRSTFLVQLSNIQKLLLRCETEKRKHFACK